MKKILYGVLFFGVFGTSSSIYSSDDRKETEVAPGPKCPISQEIIRDPVVASDGHTYERTCIEEYLRRKAANGDPPVSPLTRELLDERLVPNITLKSYAEDVSKFTDAISNGLIQLFKVLTPEVAELMGSFAKGEIPKEEAQRRFSELEAGGSIIPDIIGGGAGFRQSAVSSVEKLVKAFSGLVCTTEELRTRTYLHVESRPLPYTENLKALISLMSTVVERPSVRGAPEPLLPGSSSPGSAAAAGEEDLPKGPKDESLQKEDREHRVRELMAEADGLAHDFDFEGDDESNTQRIKNWEKWVELKIQAKDLGDKSAACELMSIIERKKREKKEVYFTSEDIDLGKKATFFYWRQLAVIYPEELPKLEEAESRMSRSSVEF